jgi:dihydroorotase
MNQITLTIVFLGIAALLLVGNILRPDIVALMLLLSLGLTGILTPQEAFALLSWRPAAIAGLLEQGQGSAIEPGSDANLCVFDPGLRWEVDPQRLASKARNTPFAGRTLTGKVRHTVLRGRPVVIDGELT